MKERWHFLKKEEKYADRILRIEHRHYHFDGAGASIPFTVVSMKNWVLTIPVTKDGKIVMVRQFRSGSDSITYEFPGGAVDDGEVFEEAALRELSEETGYECDKIGLLGVLHPNPALMTNVCHCFLADGCIKTTDKRNDLFEETSAEEYSKEEVLNMLRNGEITHAVVVAAIGLWLLK